MCEGLGFGMSVYEGWCVLGGGERELEGQLLSLDGLLGFGAGRRLSWAGSPVAQTPGEGRWQRGLDAQAMPPFSAEKIRRTGATPGNARAAGGDQLRVALGTLAGQAGQVQSWPAPPRTLASQAPNTPRPKPEY